VPDAPNARADVPIGGRDGGTGGSGGKGGNLVRNGGFDSGMTNWDTYEMNGGVATFSISGGELECVISTTTTASTNIQLQYTGGLNLVSGHNYRFTFDAYATADRALDTSIWENGHDLDNNGFAWSTYQYSWHSLTTTKQPFDAADEHRRGDRLLLGRRRRDRLYRRRRPQRVAVRQAGAEPGLSIRKE
jgi:hypothetical protein